MSFQIPRVPPSDPNVIRTSLSCALAPVDAISDKAIPIAVTLVCTASQPLTVDLGPNETGNLRFWLSSQYDVASPKKLATPPITSSGVVNISPEHPYKVRLNLGSLEPADLPRQLEVKAAIVASSESTPLVITNGTPVTLLDSNISTIEEHSSMLARSILEASTFDERSELASELAGIHEESAIPAIRAVLGKGLGIDSPFLIDGLEAIATKRAQEALISYADGKVDPADALYARSAARRMRIRTAQ